MVQDNWSWPPASLLGGLERPSCNRLLALGSLARYMEPRRVLIREGDHTTFVVVLLHGVVKATGMTADGREALLAIRAGGDLVGELAALDGQPRSATVTAVGTVVARVIKRADFLDCMRRDPTLAQAVDRSLTAKLRIANARRLDFSGCDVPIRLARVLHEVAVTYGEINGDRVVINWPLTQTELATLAGAAKPSAQKALRQLREDGIIWTGYRTITVLSLDRLKGLAYSRP